MPGHGEKLSRQQEKAIAALLTAPSIRQAATATGVTEKTLRAWLGDADFQAAYRRERRKIIEHAIGHLQGRLRKAVRCLERNLSCGKPNVEIEAAKALIGSCLKGVEMSELLEKIAEMESQIEELTHEHPREGGAAGRKA
jgi:hypothetical protein